MNLSRLFSPFKINRQLELPNRIIMASIHCMFSPDGYVNDRFNKFYLRRAEGGAGLIMVGGASFDDYGGAQGMISLQTDDFIPGFKTLTEGIHKRGAKVGIQFYHAGRYTSPKAIGGKKPLAPSPIYSDFSKVLPEEITKEQIQYIAKSLASAATRAQQAGFDLVEIIASAGYLICQFLSPLTNQRTDEYGGSWENRTRFAQELVTAVRKAVGPDFPISMRIAGHDFVTGSNTNFEAVEFCKIMERSGINLFNVTAGWHESQVPLITGDLPRGGFTYLASAIKDAVSVPVAATNRINDPLLAERILALEEADLISLARPLIADPDWPKKAQAGQFQEIKRCLACNQGCLAKMFFHNPIECLVNGMAGREYEMEDFPLTTSKRVLVIGGGPAGCEFALAAAERGHKVTLWEKTAVLGGQLKMAALPPGKKEFSTLIGYYEAMLRKYAVETVFNKEGTAKEIASTSYDIIVTATGMIPKSISLDNPHHIPVVTAYDLLQQKMIAGKAVVVIGGSSTGCELAQYLAHEGSISPEQLYFLLEHQAETLDKVLNMQNKTRRTISIIDKARIGAGFAPGTGWPVIKDLKRLNVGMYPFAAINKIGKDSVHITVNNMKAGGSNQNFILPCDTIVLSVGAIPHDQLYQELTARGVAVYNLGDSSKIGNVLEAVHDAIALAHKI